MVQACKALLLQEFDVRCEWVDIFSIPQDNLDQQQGSIDSLAVYASHCQWIVSAVPVCEHAEINIKLYTANTLLRAWPACFAALLLTLLLMSHSQGSVSICFPIDAKFIQAFFLLDVCDVVGIDNFLPFQALLEGWIASEIMRCTNPRFNSDRTLYTSRSRVIPKTEKVQQHDCLDDELQNAAQGTPQHGLSRRS